MKTLRLLKVSVVLAGCMLFNAAYAQTIKIGSFLSITGGASFLGDPALKILQLYIDKINSEGGVIGRKLELIHYDDGSDANKSNGFAKRLIHEDKVDVILGGSTTGATLAALPLAEGVGMPFISYGSGVSIVEPVRKWVFKIPHNDRMVVEKVLVDMQNRGFKKVALLSEVSGFGQSGHKETLAAAAKYGIEVVISETYSPKDTDMTAQLTKIKNNSAVQALFVFGLGQGPVIVSKNIAQLGIKLPHYESHGVASDEFVRLVGTSAEGIRLPSPAILVAQKLPANDPQKQVLMDLTTRYKERYKSNAPSFAGTAYDGLMLYVNAVKQANSVDKEKIRAALENTKGFVGASGVFNLSPKDHLGLDLSGLRMLEIRNGDWVLLEKSQ